MVSDENQFPAIDSKTSKGWTLAIKVFFSVFVVLTPLIMILMAWFTLASGNIQIEIKILVVVLAILVIGLFVWLLMVQRRTKSTTKIIRVTVDETGIHHYSNKGLVKSIQYNQLMQDPGNGKYDIFIYVDQSDTDMDLCFYIFDDALDKVVMKGLFLEGDFVITNGNSLKRHFIKGISMFRPDLKIAPGVLDLYNLKKDL